jgi:hypothetical protein
VDEVTVAAVVVVVAPTRLDEISAQILRGAWTGRDSSARPVATTVEPAMSLWPGSEMPIE